MSDTTLIITAKCRPDYFRRTLDAWGDVRGVQDLQEVVIRLARSERMMESELMQLAMEARGLFGLPLRVELDGPDDSLGHGQDRALGNQIRQCFKNPLTGFVICCDDDILVSDDVLEYFAFARSYNPSAVCAHNNLGQGWSPLWNDADADQQLVRMVPEFTSWCWGTTIGAWEHVWLPNWDWDRSSGSHPLEHGWEWQMHRIANSGVLIAVPDASRCLNIGQYGGDFAIPGDHWKTQAHSYRQHRDPVSYRMA